MKILNVNSVCCLMGGQPWALSPFWHNMDIVLQDNLCLEKMWLWPGTRNLISRFLAFLHRLLCSLSGWTNVVFNVHPRLQSTEGNYREPFKTVFFLPRKPIEGSWKEKPSLETRDLNLGLPTCISWEGDVPGGLQIPDTFQKTQFLTWGAVRKVKWIWKCTLSRNTLAVKFFPFLHQESDRRRARTGDSTPGYSSSIALRFSHPVCNIMKTSEIRN